MKDWYKYLAGFVVGIFTITALDLMPSWPPFPVAVWGDVSDWVMVGVTVVLTVFAALLPARLQKLTAHNKSRRYVLAILDEYDAVLQVLEKHASALRQFVDPPFLTGSGNFFSELYEQSREAAVQHDSFLELEALRSRLIELEKELLHPPRPPDIGDKPWDPVLDWSDSGYKRLCNELADKVDAVVSDFRRFRDEVGNW